jgi:hypothetical protein
MKIIKIGRSSGNDVVISDPYVGKTHCEFIQDDNGYYWVIDMNSKNGTFVNGVRRSGKTKLGGNEIVRIGNTTLPWLNYFNGATGGSTVIGTVVGPGSGGSNPPVEEKGNGFGITALVCGILGLSVFAIVFGAIAMNRNEKNRGLGIAGLILGIVWAVFALVIWIIRLATY